MVAQRQFILGQLITGLHALHFKQKKKINGQQNKSVLGYIIDLPQKYRDSITPRPIINFTARLYLCVIVKHYFIENGVWISAFFLSFYEIILLDNIKTFETLLLGRFLKRNEQVNLTEQIMNI